MTMGLYHFLWQGKERSVSMERLKNKMVLLSFIDDDIIKLVHSQLLIEIEGRNISYLNENEITSLTDAKRLVSSIEQAIGKPVQRWTQPVGWINDKLH